MFLSSTPDRALALPKLCVSVTGSSPAEMLSTAGALVQEFPFLEFRLDYLADPEPALPALHSFLRQNSGCRSLATCRPQNAGGRLYGTPADELRILCAAADAGFYLVDLSLESAEVLGPSALDELRRRGTAVVVSYHDFHTTGDLDAVLTRMRPFAPDFYKVVPTAKTLDDSLRVLHLLKPAAKNGHPNLIALAMDEPGVLTRTLGPRFGSAFTFAAATEAEATAPGQLTARTLTNLYRIANITETTEIYGVAGDPIRSSLSPLMLNTAFRESGRDAVYLPLKTADPYALFQLARTLPLRGFSITMPLKQAVLPFMDHTDPLAARIGAVNTVYRSADGTFTGYNTDAAGITTPIERRRPLRDARVLVLGAGGAARAAVFGCVDRGAQVSIHNRTHETARALAAEAGATAITRHELRSAHFDVLINATPAGMRGNALTLPLAEEEINAGLVFDLVYNPLETPLLTLARAKGIGVIPGVEMFVHQGARQYELWTGIPAPVEAMQKVVLEKLSSYCLVPSA